MLFLPKVVLHRRDSVLDELAVPDLFVDISLFVADVGYLALDGLDGGSVVYAAADFGLDLDLVSSYAGLHFPDNDPLALDDLLGHFLDV